MLLTKKPLFFQSCPLSSSLFIHLGACWPRRLAVICRGRFFERLLTRFSVPEEIFGPLSLRALEQDELLRKAGGRGASMGARVGRRRVSSLENMRDNNEGLREDLPGVGFLTRPSHGSPRKGGGLPPRRRRGLPRRGLQGQLLHPQCAPHAPERARLRQRPLAHRGAAPMKTIKQTNQHYK